MAREGDIIDPLHPTPPMPSRPEREERDRRERERQRGERDRSQQATSPEDYAPPPDAKVVERNAKGEITVLEKDGIRYYTPQSPMWEKGYRTSEEYIYQTTVRDKEGKFIGRTGGEARDSGSPAPYVTATNFTGKKVQIARSEIKDFDKLTPKQQFNKLVSLGIIEKGSQFIEPPIPKAKNWSYIPASEFRRVEALRKAQGKVAKTVEIPARAPKEEKLYGFKPNLPKEERLWGRAEGYVEQLTIPKAIWRILTPWVEERNETFASFVKGTPKRMFDPDTPEQKELAKIWEEENSAPMWAKVLFGPTVLKTPDGSYVTIAAGYGPPVGPATGNLARSTPQVAKQLKTIPIDWNKILRQGKNWNKIVEAIKNGTIRNAKQLSNYSPYSRGVRIEYGGNIPRSPTTPELQAFVERVQEASKAAARIAALRTAGKVEAQPWRPVTTYLTKPRMEELLSLWLTMKPNDAVQQMVRENMVAATIAVAPSKAIELISKAKPEIRNAALEQLNSKTASAVKSKSATEAQTQALTEVTTETSTEVDTKGETKTETQTKPGTETKPQAQQKPKIMPQAKPAPKPFPSPPKTSEPSPQPKPSEGTPAPAPGKEIIKEPVPPKPKEGSGGTDRQRRRFVADSSGAIAWRQGELGNKDVWHVIVSPYMSEDDVTTVLGRKPSGATIVKGPESAMKTAQLLYGKKISKKVQVDIGIVDANLEPISGNKGIKITFRPDPLQKTAGDITIGKKGKVFPLKNSERV